MTEAGYDWLAVLHNRVTRSLLDLGTRTHVTEMTTVPSFCSVST